MGRIKYLASVMVIVLVTGVFAKPPVPKSKLPLGGVTIGMTEAELMKTAKTRRRKMAGPGKGMISSKEMVQVQEYVVDRNRQLDVVSGAKAQTIMLLDGKVVAVKFHFTSKSSLDSYLKKFVRVGFKKESDTHYTGAVDVGPYAERKVNIEVSSFKVKKKAKYDVIISCLEVFGKGMTAEKLMDAQREGGVRKKKAPKDRKGMGGVL